MLGQRTFGKGTVQNMFSLDRWSSRNVNGQITVTIGKFYRVTGESTQHRGVEPDVALASPIDIEEIGESALEAALPWDRIAGVPYRAGAPRQSAGAAAGLDEEIRRAQSDPDYRWLLADIAARDELRHQKSLSLNLKAAAGRARTHRAGNAWRVKTRGASRWDNRPSEDGRGDCRRRRVRMPFWNRRPGL